MEIELDDYHKKTLQNDAKSITDSLFNGKYFRESVTRDQLNALEEFLRFSLESRFKSFISSENLGRIGLH